MQAGRHSSASNEGGSGTRAVMSGCLQHQVCALFCAEASCSLQGVLLAAVWRFFGRQSTAAPRARGKLCLLLDEPHLLLHPPWAVVLRSRCWLLQLAAAAPQWSRLWA